MEHREDKSTLDVRLTGVRDPKDPDGLLTVEDDAERPEPVRFGTDETDTLAKEQAYYARLDEHEGRTPRIRPPKAPAGPTAFG